jgi:hypothetical protein
MQVISKNKWTEVKIMTQVLWIKYSQLCLQLQKTSFEMYQYSC